MKRLIIFCGLAVVALGQQGRPAPGGPDFDMTARQISSDGHGHTHLAGNVVITTSAVVVYADAAEYDQNSHQIQAEGRVLIKLK